MSMMRCSHCDHTKNADAEVNSTWLDSGDWICTDCTELQEAYREAVKIEEQEWAGNSNVNMKRS